MMYSPFRFIPHAFFRQRPIHLTLFITGRCNQRCPFCFYGKDDSRQEMNIAEIRKLSSSMGRLLWLAISGGEIFLRNDIAEICDIFYRNNKPPIILLPTNGMMPSVIRDRVEDILGLCRKSTVVVKLSMDGVGELHDKIRNTDGSFDRVIETYEALSGLLPLYPNFELGINTVFNSMNQDSMKGIIDYVKGLRHIGTHTVSLVRGDIKNESMKYIDMNKYLSAILELESGLKDGSSAVYRFRGGRLKAAQDIMQRKLIHKTVSEGRMQIGCHAGKINAVVGHSGDVFPCEDFSLGMGNLRDFDMDMGRLLKSPLAGKVVRSIRESGCFCTHECYMMTNILFSPSAYPGLIREYLGIRPS